jgi:calcineurin-like phosphoesterase family protein
MTDIWLISDLHLGHKNIITFTGVNGGLMRPGFRDIHHHNKFITDRINSTINPQDHVWHGGDFGDPQLVKHMHGHWRNILGNHDTYKYLKKVPRFEKVEAWRKWNIDGVQFVHTHFPIHMTADQVPGKRSYQFNVHGHIHDKTIMINNQPDLRYLNVCVEQLDYTPIHIEDVVK